WGELEVHPDVLDDLGGEPGRDAGRDEMGERVVAPDPDQHRAPDKEGIDRNDPQRPEEAQLLARDGEDKVGLLEGDEAALGRRALEQAGARPPTAADRAAHLGDLV